MTACAEDIERLFSVSKGYNALFLAAGALENACEETPESLTRQGVQLLLATLADPQFETQRTSFFFYSRFAQILTSTAKQLGPHHPISRTALQGLSSLVAHATGNRHLALCHATGLLAPQTAPPPPLPAKTTVPCSCAELLNLVEFPPQTLPTFAGRSLLYAHQEKILVIKCARPGEDPKGLASEWHWMKILGNRLARERHIPTPVAHPLLRMTGLPEGAASETGIAFLTTAAYFTYPNEPLAPINTDQAVHVIGNAAYLFGHLAAHGILHTAPVPLFHNRVQTDRREDDGVYLWQKGGRLDRWLASCRYPNFGLSGLRDFEHIKTAPEMSTHEFYRTMGNQILSLLLVAGSHFRSLGGPSPASKDDHRHLFDIAKLNAMLTAIMNNYYRGYTGNGKDFPHEAGRTNLAVRMVEEMGQDTHMEEVLRTRDQQEMGEKAFRQFLIDREYTQEEAQKMPRGTADIVLFTGPHLGHFNGKISCPELIEFTATLASITMANGFLSTPP